MKRRGEKVPDISGRGETEVNTCEDHRLKAAKVKKLQFEDFSKIRDLIKNGHNDGSYPEIDNAYWLANRNRDYPNNGNGSKNHETHNYNRYLVIAMDERSASEMRIFGVDEDPRELVWSELVAGISGRLDIIIRNDEKDEKESYRVLRRNWQGGYIELDPSQSQQMLRSIAASLDPHVESLNLNTYPSESA